METFYMSWILFSTVTSLREVRMF